MPSVHQLSHANSDSHAIAYLDHVLQHTQFFQKYAGNAGVKTASLGTESFTIDMLCSTAFHLMHCDSLISYPGV
jgi:hypothetical protein